ncbi:transporter [Flavobacterium rivuli WB 3.3-2 = DSM 21788]|uniref:Transporter n=1 Tax=Flavobacterium rivuli WB 3.3-2 = DSM 21788 TaxID=1121895 RepID=A0A0A2M2M6_9FLAO|nr:TolC family protein [Flavobacterium rivuli]KGO85871.1 transporter [Flavobacterium rivuli WB 3.3-2 = DSM 21788]
MSKKIITLLLIAVSCQLYAQETWQLRQCIEYGLEHNRNNAIYTNQKRAADARAREALADYLPRISLTSTLDDNLRLQQTVIPAGIFGDQDLRVSLTKKFASNATAQVDQVLYDQALLTGLRANKYNRQQAALNLQQSREAIIYNITAAYLDIFVYRQQLELLHYNLETYQGQINVLQLQVDKGVTLQKDLDKVQVDYNNTRSQQRVAQSNLELAHNELKFEMGYPFDTPLKVDTAAPANPAIKKDVAFSPEARIDYRLAALDVRLKELQQKSIRAGALPTLSAYARYGAVGFGDHLDQAYRDLNPFSAVGLKLTIPLLDFYRRNARYRQAEVERLNAEENLTLSEGRYRMEFDNAQAKLLQAQSNVENDQRNVTLAQSVLTVTDLQFKKGTTDLTDWLTTQNALKQSQNSYLSSLYTYYLARIDLEKAAGTLQNFYNSL